jgi:putative tryptophan/tyrosine transport system substrate-binding protein
MNRRDTLLVLAALWAISRSVFADTSGKVWRVGYLSNAAGPGLPVEALREQLLNLGYAVGRNLSIEYRWGSGKEERLPLLANELVRIKVDLILVSGEQSIAAARHATTSVPIVMASSADPVGTGAIASLARPGGNVTGLTIQSTDLAAKRIQLQRETVPGLKRLGILALKGGPASPFFIEQTRRTAQQLGIALFVEQHSAPEQLAGAFAAMQREHAQALIVQSSPFTLDNRKQIAERAAQARLPTLFETSLPVEAGGLMSYGSSSVDLHRRAAFYVDRILKGAKPADLPVEQPTRFELVINLRTARALGLAIPNSLLLRADRVIE